MIELAHVSRTYTMGGRPLHALDDVSESIRDGEYVSIMGPSGSGKSSLLHIIGCLDRPTEGTYHLNGVEVGSLSEQALSEQALSAIRRDEIGFVFQTFHLVPRLSAAENVEFPMLFAGLPRAARQERIEAALDAVGLLDRVGHRPAELSGGERQRVAIARAIVMRPRILLADEPTGNLDSTSGSQVLELLEGMNGNGLTLLVVTHDPDVAARAQRTVWMLDGRIDRRLDAAELRARTAPLERTPAP